MTRATAATGKPACIRRVVTPCIHILNMSPTTQAILRSIAASDESLTACERDAIARLVDGRADAPQVCAPGAAPLLLTQKQAASALGISRVTLWRMTREAVFAPVEITPGHFRYRREEVEAVARRGRDATLPRRTGRPCAVARAA